MFALNYLKSSYLIGILLVGVFVILSAGKEVFVGHLVQAVDPFLLNLLCFLPITIFFCCFHSLKSKENYLQLVKTRYSAVLGLNLSTTCFWIASFYALKYVEPSIENSVNVAVGPMVTILTHYFSKSNQEVTRLEKIVSLGILLDILFVAAISLEGKSGVSYVSFSHILMGIVCCVIAGIAIVGNTIFSKQLSRANLSTSFVLSVRFYLLLVTTFIFWLLDGASTQGVVGNYSNIFLLAVFGIGLPLFILQKGIERSEPITVAFIIALGPVFTYLFELFDRRLVFSPYTLAGVLIIVGLVLSSIIAGYKKHTIKKVEYSDLHLSKQVSNS